jgi:hypothetical protein
MRRSGVFSVVVRGFRDVLVKVKEVMVVFVLVAVCYRGMGGREVVGDPSEEVIEG